MIVESWLNEIATNETRGRTISVYRLVDLSGLFIGQLIFAATAPTSFALFAIVASFVCLSLIPVSASTARNPGPIAAFKIDLSKVWSKSQTALVTCFVIGLGNGAFWTLAPLFAYELTTSSQWVSIFMSIMIVGGGIAVWPMGVWSDHQDRRFAILACTTIVIIASIIAVISPFSTTINLALVAALYGIGALPQYGLAVAHANDTAEEGEFIEISSSLLLAFGLGAILGPTIGGGLMTSFGPLTLFVFIGGIHVLSGLYAVWRIFVYDISGRTKEQFVPIPRTTQTILDVDPRGEDQPDNV